jgi:hypothetical protein
MAVGTITIIIPNQRPKSPLLPVIFISIPTPRGVQTPTGILARGLTIPARYFGVEGGVMPQGDGPAMIAACARGLRTNGQVSHPVSQQISQQVSQ